MGTCSVPVSADGCHLLCAHRRPVHGWPGLAGTASACTHVNGAAAALLGKSARRMERRPSLSLQPEAAWWRLSLLPALSSRAPLVCGPRSVYWLCSCRYTSGSSREPRVSICCRASRSSAGCLAGADQCSRCCQDSQGWSIRALKAFLPRGGRTLVGGRVRAPTPATTLPGRNLGSPEGEGLQFWMPCCFPGHGEQATVLPMTQSRWWGRWQ